MSKFTKEQKIILVGGALLILLGAIYRFYPDLQDMVSGSGDMALQEKQLTEYRAMLKNRGSLERELSALKRTLRKVESGLLTGETPALGAVDIQNSLTRIADKSQVEIKSMRVLKPPKPAKTAPGESFFLRIPVNITLVSSVRQLKEILYRIETAPKRLIITEMNVTVVSKKKPDDIRTTLTVEGLMRKKDI